MSDFRFTRPDPFPPIVKNLIIINALVFLCQIIFDKQYGITEMIAMWPIMPEKLHDILVSNGYLSGSQGFKPYQIVTHLFAHSPQLLFHILFNMFALWMFGRVLENVWGGKRFLFFYLASGLGAAALHLGIQYFRAEQLLHAFDANDITAIKNNIGAVAPALGASGAVMGVFAAFAYTFPNTELYLMFIPIPIKAKWAILGFVALDLFGGVARVSGDNIAHFAHLGGAITGFLIVLYWNKRNRKTLY
ncbi:MAG TPA: rhomboid family intramembrane serine protease [Chitinophagaceae bacterium]|nr:rhomboid family intramembrane serine protease [Chitinophagaceae bacterium]MCB9055201.1 rhomboid family intramembrane serine protease [Chitinophagales bacterium]HRX92507.1 rhomboid family intramembrane serine protease [Chitinophagaceae bacterium]